MTSANSHFKHFKGENMFDWWGGGAGAAEPMFAWLFCLQRIPSWKLSGLESWEGSRQTPNNKNLLCKQGAWTFLHMSFWHSRCGWAGLRGLHQHLSGPKEGSNVKASGALSVYLTFLDREKRSFTAQQGDTGVDSGLLCVSKVVSTLEATSHLSASL